jgi:hypothetical protein
VVQARRRDFAQGAVGYSGASMAILGLNAYHADASVALVHDGKLVSAIEEERLNRKKHCAGFPAPSAKAALEQAGVRLRDVGARGRLAGSVGASGPTTRPDDRACAPSGGRRARAIRRKRGGGANLGPMCSRQS